MWFSEDPDRRWVEKFFLIYSPIWMAMIALCMITGMMRSWGNLGYLMLGTAVGVTPIIAPFFLAPTQKAKAYAARFNLWIFLFSFAGNYLFTRYIEDMFGLFYNFNMTLNLGAVGIGKTQGNVPVLMFFLTQAYFLTYFTLIFMGYRKTGRKWPMWFVMAALCAFAETAAMASPLIDDLFHYSDKVRMLTWGTACYGSGFLVSAPLLYRMQADWKWSRVIIEVSAAVTLQLYAYEAFSWVLR